jgi:predicted acyl esterase
MLEDSMVLRVISLFTLFIGAALFAENEDDPSVQPDLVVNIPMRDGTELPTELHFPASHKGKLSAGDLPCVLIRSPRGRAPVRAEFSPIKNWGYVVAIQDTRSAIDTTGKEIPYMADGWGALQDGYDTVEWLAKSDYTNGRVGTVGESALGITQALLAPSAPPSLKCQHMRIAASSMYHHAIFSGGQLKKIQVEGWLGDYSKDNRGVLSFLLSQPNYNELWASLDAISSADKVNTPAIHLGGWYDTFSQGTIDAFVSRHYGGSENAKGKQKLVMGPWTHMYHIDPSFGDFAVPDAAHQPPVDLSMKRWLDHHLKEEKTGLEEEPAVIYFTMGPFDGTPSKGNRWQTADHWPVPAKETKFFLTPERTLRSDTIPPQAATFTYLYDPQNPTPTIGGRDLFLAAGPKDQRQLEQRDDVLIFTTPTLGDDTEVTGRIQAKLYVSTSAIDTDFAIRLSDVYPDGRSILVADGITRLASVEHERGKLDRSKPIEIDIDLWSTSMVFAKGHQIRISISSANYPRYEKNLNMTQGFNPNGKPCIAKNTLWVGKQFQSHITLPIVKDSVNTGIEAESDRSAL